MEQVDTKLVNSTTNNGTNKEIEDKRRELAQQEFAQEAKRLRDRANLSQKQLGMLMGIEQAIISRIELANYGITLDVVLLYARTFNEDPYRLANVYWGNAPHEIADFNKQVLDSVWEMLAQIYQPKITPLDTDRKPRNEQAYKGVKEAKEINKEINPTKKPATKKPKGEDTTQK